MSDSHLSESQRQQLLQAAREAIQRAYAPYSQFRVGAAVLTEQGNLFSGCNVENASYGLSICAERVAICSAVAAEGKDVKIRAIAVLALSGEEYIPTSPCGACRQFISEFGVNAIVFFLGRDGLQEARAAELLPEGFRL